MLVSIAVSQLLLARLVQSVTFKLRLQLTNQILACPLRPTRGTRRRKTAGNVYCLHILYDEAVTTFIWNDSGCYYGGSEWLQCISKAGYALS